MTPEERATAVLATFWQTPGWQTSSSQIDAVAAAIREAVAAERERCAAKVELMSLHWCKEFEAVREVVAARLRALPPV